MEDNLEYIFDYVGCFSKSNFRLKPINTKIQFLLSKKHTVTNFEDYSSFICFWKFLLDILNLCIHPLDRHFLKKINILECLELLIFLRLISCGNELKLIITENDNPINLNIDLGFVSNEWFINLEKKYKEEEPHIIVYDNYEICVDLPTNLTYAFYNFSNTNEYSFDDYILNYIEYIRCDKLKVNFKKLKKEEKKIIFNSLPSKLGNKIKAKVLFINGILSSLDFYQTPNLIKDRLHFLNDSIPELLKLIYCEKMTNIMKEHYILSKKQINNLYIETLSPMERQIFLNFIQEEYHNKETAAKSNSGENNAISLFSDQ